MKANGLNKSIFMALIFFGDLFVLVDFNTRYWRKWLAAYSAICKWQGTRIHQTKTDTVRNITTTFRQRWLRQEFLKKWGEKKKKKRKKKRTAYNIHQHRVTHTRSRTYSVRVCLLISVCLSVCVSLCLPVCQSVCGSVCLSVSVSLPRSPRFSSLSLLYTHTHTHIYIYIYD